MNKTKLVLAALLAALAISAPIYAQRSTPVAAVRSFYSFDRTHARVFIRRNVDSRQPYFSPALYSLFLTELRREDEYLKKNPTDKPYFGDGLPFQPYDETCTAGRRAIHKSLKIQPAFEKEDKAAVTATFAFPAPCKDADPTTYTIGLIKVRGSWLIDDVNYGDDRSLKVDLNRKDY